MNGQQTENCERITLMSAEQQSTWLTVFVANYKGESNESKELEPYVKENYKGNSYIPWATIERLMYMQDPNASIEVVKEYSSIVHTTQFKIENKQKNGEKNIETYADILYHTLVLKGTFLGKTMFEYYPIQDNSYEAPKVIDSNMVNKSIQRAKAKLISRLTGLALKLYEGLDLQFETKDEPVVIKVQPIETLTPISDQTTPVNVVETPVSVPKEVKPIKKVENKVETTQNSTLAVYLKENAEKLSVGIQKMNANLVVKYGADGAFNLETDSVSDIELKLAKINNPDIFVRAVKSQSGIQ